MKEGQEKQTEHLTLESICNMRERGASSQGLWRTLKAMDTPASQPRAAVRKESEAKKVREIQAMYVTGFCT